LFVSARLHWRQRFKVLLRQIHPSEHGLKSSVGAKFIKLRLNSVSTRPVAMGIDFSLEHCHRFFFLVQPDVCEG